MLQITNLTKRFGSTIAVNQVSLQASTPGLYIFVGANGSGKTTLFNLINGFIVPDAGQIMLDKCNEPDKIRALLGISTEPFISEPSLTVAEIINIKQNIIGKNRQSLETHLQFWELYNALHKPFKTLSTGMKKRLSLALSLMGAPDYLFWDEPFNGLDPVGIALLNQLINRLIEKNKYIFLSTHLLNEITANHAHFFVMKNGKLIDTVTGDTNTKHTTILNLLKN